MGKVTSNILRKFSDFCFEFLKVTVRCNVENVAFGSTFCAEVVRNRKK